jgi:FtsP/CotA-like multicopper oxidase with cupredoxin domain
VRGHAGIERAEFDPIEGEGLIMRVSKIAGLAVFVAVFFAAAQVEPIDGLLAQIWANICASGAEDATLRPVNAPQSSAQAAAAPYVWAQQNQVVCPPQPTSYASLPSVTAPGDLTVPLSLGAGTGAFKNPTLCFVSNSLTAPTIRIFRGNTLTVKLTNTLINSPDPTENCPIDNYPGGPPRLGQPCTEPESSLLALPGRNGTFYPIQADLSHTADGSTNLHTHGFSDVSPQPCHDEVIRSVVWAANWPGREPLLPCQSAPNELTYSYDIPPDHPAGLYFYHTHRHKQVFAQTMMGAAGAIVIESEQDKLRAARGVSDDVMLIHDMPANFISSSAPALPYAAVLAQLNGRERSPTAAIDSTIDRRIDRDNEISCMPKDPDTGGGEQYGRVLLNGALVQETPAFPPPDDQVLVKTMKPGERQIWRIVNASATVYLSPQLVLSVNGKTQVLPLVITALDGVPVHDDNGHPYFDIVDTTKHPLVLANANRVEILVHAPPPGATLYLDSLQVAPGCAGNSMPHRRLLRVVSGGANVSPAQYATAAADGAAENDVAAAQNDADLLPTEPETQYTHILDTPPSVRRVFAFTEYAHTFTIEKSKWIIGPPKNPNPNIIDYYLTMIESSDGQGKPVALIPFNPHVQLPDVVVHLRGKESVTEDWLLQNYTLEAHNFHIHQMHFRDITAGDTSDRAPLLDTVNIPPATRALSADGSVDVPMTPGFTRVRLKFTRAMIGEFVFHCHFLSHEDAGMMKKVRVVAD